MFKADWSIKSLQWILKKNNITLHILVFTNVTPLVDKAYISQVASQHLSNETDAEVAKSSIERLVDSNENLWENFIIVPFTIKKKFVLITIQMMKRLITERLPLSTFTSEIVSLYNRWNEKFHLKQLHHQKLESNRIYHFCLFTISTILSKYLHSFLVKKIIPLKKKNCQNVYY